jgi:hypothetical protein
VGDDALIGLLRLEVADEEFPSAGNPATEPLANWDQHRADTLLSADGRIAFPLFTTSVPPGGVGADTVLAAKLIAPLRQGLSAHRLTFSTSRPLGHLRAWLFLQPAGQMALASAARGPFARHLFEEDR